MFTKYQNELTDCSFKKFFKQIESIIQIVNYFNLSVVCKKYI